MIVVALYYFLIVKKMSDHDLDRVDIEEEGVEQQLPIDLRRLLGRPKIPAFGENTELREWLATIDKSHTV